MYNFGDVVLASVQFVDMLTVKTRPAVVLFAEYGNIVVAGITSNREVEGIPLTLAEGAVKPSVIKLNYIFTISKQMIQKRLFTLSAAKKRQIREELLKKLA